MIHVEGLSARYGDFRLQEVSLHVPNGESLVILGPSGAGKSLLLETMLGLKPPESGGVTVDDRDVTRLPPEERQVAYMPQDLALFPHLSVRDNILFGLKARGRLHDAATGLGQMADLLHIHHLLNRRSVGTLSGGERQRVALARALIVRPKVLFLDESFSSLDHDIRKQIVGQFRELQRSLQLTVISVTHHLEEAAILGDHVAMMMEGRILQIDPPDILFSNPASLRVARFLQLRNFFAVETADPCAEGLLCRIGGLDLVVHPPRQPISDARVMVCIPPGEIHLLPKAASRSPTRGYPARVLGLVHEGLQHYIRLQLGGRDGPIADCAILPHLLRHGCPAEHDHVQVRIAPEAVALFPYEDKKE
ncbi:MAG: ATP-binding cassette domain-containing protein [Lentisphaerota bacterium]